jgi:hypothetical protein
VLFGGQVSCVAKVVSDIELHERRAHGAPRKLA